MTLNGNGIKEYQARAIRTALKAYVDHKIMVNRTYTPANMMRTAQNLTGKKFKARAYKEAIKALTQLIEG